MHLPRRSVPPSLVAAFVCTTIVSTVLADRGRSGDSPSPRPEGAAQREGTREPERTPFTHAKHVPSIWLDPDVPERQRDCRGCHDYTHERTNDPQGVCTECHFSDETNGYEYTIEAEGSFLTDLEGLRSPGSLFQHSNHLALECRECHAVEGPSIEAPMLMPKGGGLDVCLQCHVGQKPRQAELVFISTWRNGDPITPEYRAKARAKLPSSIVASLNGSAPMGPNRPGERNVRPFRHDDHILTDSLTTTTPRAALESGAASVDAARRGNCGSCHAPMFDAAAGLAVDAGFEPFRQADETCGTCHVADGDLTPLRFDVEHGSRPSRTASTFAHATHLGWERPAGDATRCSDSGYAAIETNGCNACHVASGDDGTDFEFVGELNGERSFQGCQSCHGTSAWAPIEHGEWWTHENHGSWQSCTPCHDFADSSFGTNRPFTTVVRAVPTPFRIETQSHPHITVEPGEAIEASCAKCHRQPVRELPSRIREARFQHSTHLPPNPDGSACLDCHATPVAGAETSGDLGLRSDARPTVTYDESACATCHLGSIPEALPPGDSGPETATRRVPEFSHAMHQGKLLSDGTAVGCATCHDPGAAAPPAAGADARPLATVGTRATALDCSMCHSHAPPEAGSGPRAPSTGRGVTATEVSACTLCHVGGIPAPGQTFEWPTAQVVDLAGEAGQFHAATDTGEGTCSSCHIDGTRLISAVSAPSGSRVFARRTFYLEPTSGVEKPAIHRGGTRKVVGNIDCFACHWTRTLSDSAGEGSAPTNPERASIRQFIGDDLRDFPGGRAVASDR